MLWMCICGDPPAPWSAVGGLLIFFCPCQLKPPHVCLNECPSLTLIVSVFGVVISEKVCGWRSHGEKSAVARLHSKSHIFLCSFHISCSCSSKLYAVCVQFVGHNSVLISAKCNQVQDEGPSGILPLTTCWDIIVLSLHFGK